MFLSKGQGRNFPGLGRFHHIMLSHVRNGDGSHFHGFLHPCGFIFLPRREVKRGPEFVVEFQPRLKGLAEPGGKSVENSRPAVHNKGLQFFIRHVAAGDNFADAELAGTAGNGVQRVFQAVGMAGRAVQFHFRQFHLLLGFPEILHPLHDFPGQGLNALHEGIPRQGGLFHLLELVFPFPGQAGGGERFQADAFQQGNQFNPAARRQKFAAVPDDVFLGNQPFNDGGAGGGSAQAAFAHGGGQFFVMHQFSCPLHGGQQRGFVVPGGRLGHGVADFNLTQGGLLPVADGHQLLLGGSAGLPSVNGLPARLHKHPARGQESVRHAVLVGNERGSPRVFKHGSGEEDGQETGHDHFKEFLRVPGKLLHLPGRDDGKVVAHLFCIKHAPVGLDALVVQNVPGKGGEFRVLLRHRAYDAVNLAQIIFRQVAGVRTRISEHLVLFIAFLGQLQRALGGKTVAVGGFPLKGSQVIQQRGDRRDRFLFFRHRAGFSAAAVADDGRLFRIPDALRAGVGMIVFLPVTVNPTAGVRAGLNVEFGPYFRIGLRFKRLDFQFPLRQNSQRGRLHAPGGGDVEAAAGLQDSQGAGAVQPHQPV